MKALILLTALAASPAMAQECIGTADAYASLINNYGEERLAMAMRPDGSVIELWGSRDTGTWSMFITLPNGLSCSVGSGQGFETFAAKPNV